MLRRTVVVGILLLCGGACGAAAVLFIGCGRNGSPAWDAAGYPVPPDDRPRPPVAAPSRPVKAIDRAIVPGTQGAPDFGRIAAKAVCFGIAAADEFRATEASQSN